MYLTNAALTDELQTQGYTTQAITNNRAIRPELGFDGWDRHRIVRDHERFARPGLRRFSEMMPEGGYDSVERAFLTAVVETRDPLSLLAGIRMKLSNPPASATRYPDSGARRTNELVESWVAETEEPFFMYLNYLEPHLPYDPLMNILICTLTIRTELVANLAKTMTMGHISAGNQLPKNKNKPPGTSMTLVSAT
jgi:hypothetical protein